MEGNDVFADAGVGVEIGKGEDPFTGGEDWAGFGVEGQQAQPEPSTGELPVVDKEGEPVAEPRASSEEELARAEEGYQYRVSRGEPVSSEMVAAHERFVANQRVEPANEAGNPDATPAPLQAQEGGLSIAEQEKAEAQANVESGLPPAPEAPSPAASPQAAQEPPAVPDAPPATDEPAPEPQEAAPEPEEDAPVPEETQSASGKTTHRRYIVLKATETGRFEQLAWYEDKDGKMVTRGTPGAKRQTVALSRGTEDALKIGYAAVGSPQDGATLVAVAALHFQPRRVRPKPPEPSRARLEIS